MRHAQGAGSAGADRAGTEAGATAREPAHFRLVADLELRGLTVATGESLTAGALSSHLAEVPGVSAVLRGGVVAYCNEVKQSVLAVDAELLRRRGAVDAAVAAQMAAGAAQATGALLGVSTTGVAGPEPHQGKPVGTVFVGVAFAAGVRDLVQLPPQAVELTSGNSAESEWISGAVQLQFTGGRAAVREQSVSRSVLVVQEMLR